MIVVLVRFISICFVLMAGLLIASVVIGAWPRPPRRTSQVWCPCCHRDLNGDSLSFQWDRPTVGVLYRCATCATESRWDFDAPAPILLSDTHYTDGRPCWCGTTSLHVGDDGEVIVHRSREEAH